MPFFTYPDGVVAHVSLGGPTRRIMIDGREYLFEMHPHCGPMPTKKNGAERDLGPRHKFWHAVTQWSQQGERIDPDGLCVWSEPEPDDLSGHVRVGRNLFPKATYERLIGEAEPVAETAGEAKP